MTIFLRSGKVLLKAPISRSEELSSGFGDTVLQENMKPIGGPLQESDIQYGTPSICRKNGCRKIAGQDEPKIHYGYSSKEDVVAKLSPLVDPVRTALDLKKLPSASSGYTALPLSGTPRTAIDEDLSALLIEGYTYIEWNGCHPRPILDGNNVIFACLAGRPEDPAFDLACKNAYDKLLTIGECLRNESPTSTSASRRGSFPSLNVGVTHGKGTKRPINLHGGKRPGIEDVRKHIRELLDDQDIRSLASFASYALSFWAPNLYKYYKDDLSRLWAREPHLIQNFVESVFPCATFNFGPKAWTRRHRDSMNCAFGMCAIQALGDFDHTKGGHLVLPDLKLVIEFPSGATVLLPSATLIHSNVPVREGERRASFTQFCSGGLFRYVDSHFMTEKALKISNKAEYTKMQKEKSIKWSRGIGLLSKLSNIVDVVV